MSKKSILVLAMTLSMVAILAIGGTLAYFTDDDRATNTFTVGKVDIELNEEYEQNSKLYPGVDVNKDVKVTNKEGSEDAYVRVHIAFPAVLDSGSEDLPQFAAYNNKLHWNFTKASFEDGQWNWSTSIDGAQYPGNGGAWNSYETEINGIDYTVYVATYETKLTAGQQTATESLTKVYLDTSITNEDITTLKTVLGENWNIYVVAEGAQAASFTDAYDALNTAFGVPGTYDVEWVAAN